MKISALVGFLAALALAPAAHAQSVSAGLSIPQVAALGGVSLRHPPLTSLPQSGAVIFDLNPDSLIGQSTCNGSCTDGAIVTSITDSVGGLAATATAAVGPTFKLNIANGHAALRQTVLTKYLNLGRPSALATPMSDPHGWSMIIVFRNATGTSTNYPTMFGDILTKVSSSGLAFVGASANVRDGTTPARSYSSSDPNTGIHTFIYSGDEGAGNSNGNIGRLFLDGTMFSGLHSTKVGTNTDPLLIGNVADATGGTPNGSRGFLGDILRIIIWNTGISAPEAWQADAWARTTYGKALATAGMNFFPVFDGDSQTQGTGATPDTAMPVLVANTNGYANGGFANVGKPSAAVATGTLFGNNLVDSAARDVDGFRTVTGLPIVLVVGEYYNQGVSGGTTGQGDTLAGNNRLYAQLRKAADPHVTIVMWTSLGNYNKVGTARNQFNSDLVNAPGPYIDALIPVHTDTNIGVDAALGTTSGGSTVSSDGIHLNSTGTPFHAALVAPYVHR